MKTAVAKAVKRELEFAAYKRCAHLETWPSEKEVWAGVVVCPFCMVAEYQKELVKQETEHKKNRDRSQQKMQEFLERANELNMRNTKLQVLLMELCQTPEQAERIRALNAGELHGSV